MTSGESNFIKILALTPNLKRITLKKTSIED